MTEELLSLKRKSLLILGGAYAASCRLPLDNTLKGLAQDCLLLLELRKRK